MKCGEVFSVLGRVENDQILDAYWEIELMIAGIEVGYSDLLYTSVEERTCALCGAVVGTNETGMIMACSHDECVSVRNYFGIHGLTLLNVSTSKANANRKAFLFNRLRKDFGGTPLNRIPDGKRLAYLQKAMGERVISEAKNNGV